MNTNKTASERQERYGDFGENAKIITEMVGALRKGGNWDKLTPTQQHAYYMICTKMARSVCGDPEYFDNAHDIVGYAQHVEKEIVKINQSKGVFHNVF